MFKNLLYLLTFIFSSQIYAQIIYSENFESGALPAGWNSESNATDGGWRITTNTALSSAYFGILPNGSNFIAGTNDDQCNCDKSNDLLVSPPIDLSQVTAVTLNFDAYYGDSNFQGVQEDATIEASTDGINWVVLEDLGGNTGWNRQRVNLSSMAGNATVYLGFRYNDSGSWLFGFAIDNITVEVPLQLDGGILKLNDFAFGELNNSYSIGGTIVNNGAEMISTAELQYSINGETPIMETFTDLNLAPFDSQEFTFAQSWTPSEEGSYNITVDMNSVNEKQDEEASNNSDAFSTRIYAPVTVPNKIDELLAAVPEIVALPQASQYLDKPTDLDFFPVLGKDELWIVNQRTESEGGSTLTISDASLSGTPSDYLLRVDGNAWHFMSLPTGIAFSPDNYNFGTSPGVRDANHNGGTFTGPTLWSSDPVIYAQPSGGNGSHLDMLHGSPFSMGIAHEKDNVFWIYDNFYKDIVRYDFQEDHGPGADDHADGIVRRFKNMGINADSDIPNHLILDKESNWLYIVDNGNDRVLRLDITSGTVNIPQALINEELAEHTAIQGYTSEVIIDSGLEQACGIEIMENRLLVGDYFNGDIRVYDMDNNFEFLGIIPTGIPGLTGIKVGPDGNVWYTNRILNSVSYAMPGENVNVTEIPSSELNISPNPTSGIFVIELDKTAHSSESFELTIQDSQGKVVLKNVFNGGKEAYDVSGFASGLYLISLRSDSEVATQKLMINK